jgi:multidrug efflux pump
MALFFGLSSLPSSFLPDEDQGYFMSSIQLPSDATMQRTLKVVQKFEEEIASQPAVESNIMILGFGFQALVRTRPWLSPP